MRPWRRRESHRAAASPPRALLQLGVARAAIGHRSSCLDTPSPTLMDASHLACGCLVPRSQPAPAGAACVGMSIVNRMFPLATDVRERDPVKRPTRSVICAGSAAVPATPLSRGRGLRGGAGGRHRRDDRSGRGDARHRPRQSIVPLARYAPLSRADEPCSLRPDLGCPAARRLVLVHEPAVRLQFLWLCGVGDADAAFTGVLGDAEGVVGGLDDVQV